ncbi:hypothetical protein Bca4012_103725 [Brassica carinata]
MTIRQYAYQHAGPSRGLSAGDIRHEDCPWVIFATRTVRQYAYQHAGPSRDCPVIFATRTVRQHAYQHAGPSRGLSGDFRHDDYPPVRISARWPFPWTIRGDIRHEDCPRTVRQTHISTLALPVDCPVIFATRTVRQHAYHHPGAPRGPTVGDFRPRGLSVGDYRQRGLSVRDSITRGLSVRTHISTLALPVDCPVIFATRTVRQHAYQHAGPSRGLSAVIFATRTVRG